MPDFAPHLPISRYKLRFAAESPFHFTGFSGSAWRGVLGHTLKKTVCITRQERCPDCMLYRSCVYPYVFETPAPPDSLKLRNYQTVPHPFVLELPWGVTEAARTFETGLTLFGRGNLYVAYLIHALRAAALRGVGHSPPLHLEAVDQFESEGCAFPVWREDEPLSLRAAFLPPIPPAPDAIRILLLTPLRLRLQDRYVSPDRFRFSDLFGSLLSRISSLRYFHTDTPLEADFAGLSAAAREVAFAARRVTWCDWTRRSSRQRQEMQMGGLMGAITVAGDFPRWSEMWPYLWLGQWTHAGKATSMGLGRYRIETL